MREQEIKKTGKEKGPPDTKTVETIPWLGKSGLSDAEDDGRKFSGEIPVARNVVGGKKYNDNHAIPLDGTRRRPPTAKGSEKSNSMKWKKGQ